MKVQYSLIGGLVLDNKDLSEVIKFGLRCMTYDQQTEIWDKNCASCPFSAVKIKTSFRNVPCHNIDEARQILSGSQSESTIVRSCKYGDTEYSLFEIVTNTCRFWDEKKIEKDTETILEEYIPKDEQ